MGEAADCLDLLQVSQLGCRSPVAELESCSLSIMHESDIYLKKIQGVMSCSLGDLGGRSMMSTSGGLNPSAVAGGPSVTRLTHSSCTAVQVGNRGM